ncbi:helitron helicase-like domain-containing protein [Artemisia annua]|uniref:Helitron helicase-like domain-containing protein n=1 Tax=Artemisia annua TaxID=35608 RepID=A0A2U1PVL6_ARTAN|nr:helitron helicase-like domain-containing protein [Artemisia annua]
MPRRLLRTQFTDFTNNYMSNITHNEGLQNQSVIDTQNSLASNGNTIPYNTFPTNENVASHLSSNAFKNRAVISPTSLPVHPINETNPMLQLHGEASRLSTPYGNNKNYHRVLPRISPDNWNLGNQHKKPKVLEYLTLRWRLTKSFKHKSITKFINGCLFYAGASALSNRRKRKTGTMYKSGFEDHKRHKDAQTKYPHDILPFGASTHLQSCSYMKGNAIPFQNAQFSSISSSISKIGETSQYHTTMPIDAQSIQTNDRATEIFACVSQNGAPSSCHSLPESHASFNNKGKGILFESTSVDSDQVEPEMIQAGPSKPHSEVDQASPSDPYPVSQPSYNASTTTYTQDVSHLYIDIGDAQYACEYCGAAFWYSERLKGSSHWTKLKYSKCCAGGQLYNVVGTREYQLPSSGTLGAIVFESSANSQTDYDVIIEYKDRGPQRINKLHSSYMSLQYPLLFVYGQPGFNTKMTLKEMAGKRKRKKKLSMNMYYKYQLHERFGHSGEADTIGDPIKDQMVNRIVEIQNLNCVSIQLTLWDQLAETFKKYEIDRLEKPVIMAVSSCQVTRYHNKLQLQSTAATYYYINPKIPQLDQYRAQYKELFNLNPLLEIVRQPYQDKEKEKTRIRFPLAVLLKESPKTHEGVRFTCEGTITGINTSRDWCYPACPTSKDIVGVDFDSLLSSLDNPNPKDIPTKIQEIIGKRHIFQFHYNTTSKQGPPDFIFNNLLDKEDPPKQIEDKPSASTAPHKGSEIIETSIPEQEQMSSAIVSVSAPTPGSDKEESATTTIQQQPATVTAGLPSPPPAYTAAGTPPQPEHGLARTSSKTSVTSNSKSAGTKRALFQDKAPDAKKNKKE